VESARVLVLSSLSPRTTVEVDGNPCVQDDPRLEKMLEVAEKKLEGYLGGAIRRLKGVHTVQCVGLFILPPAVL